jgi:anti-sigma factor RsiW
MTCRDAQEFIEAIAAGEVPAGDACLAHVQTCAACAAAVAQARAIEQALSARPVPVAPARFPAAVAARIRRERWRSEQHVDRMFNLAVAVALVAIAGAAVALVNVSGVTGAIAAGMDAVQTLASETAARGVASGAPALPAYLLGGGFLITALFVWSWAERSGRSS